MVDRWTVERAVRESALDPPGRQLILTLLTWADHDTAMIPAAYTPSLTTLARATGLAGSTVKTWLNFLEVAGWVVRWRPGLQAAQRAKTRTRYALRLPPRATRSLRRPADAAGRRPPSPTPADGAAAAGPTGGGVVPDVHRAATPPAAEPSTGGTPIAGSAGAGVGPPGGPTRSDTSDMTRPAGGPTTSDMSDTVGPPGGLVATTVGPATGPIMSGMPDMIGPSGGRKPYTEKTNRARTPAHPPARARERPTATAAGAAPVAGFGRVGDHRYVEGVNGYCAVAGCRRSAPLHAAPPTPPQPRRPTP